jgi:hypothetical protein
MKKIYYMIYTTTIIIMAVQGCKKPYLPGIVATSSNYLVVEGVINTGRDSTSIRLSRTVQLSSTTQFKPELKAALNILTDGGSSFPLKEKGNGYYVGPGLNSNATNKYSLKITTSDAKVYQSDFVSAKNSPPIDSVYYRQQSNGVSVYADTHDPSHNSTYYRWDYEETYIIHPAFDSYDYFSQIPIDTVLPRSLGDQVYTCWISDASSDIVLNSTAKLSSDVIANNRITSVAAISEKIEDRYSILVKQYALTADAFNYYQQLKKNTEQVGSIFDAQPSELAGNIHCISNPAEAVIGYVTAGVPSESRLFIDNRNLPAWHAITPYENCKLDTMLFKGTLTGRLANDVQIYIYSGQLMPIFPIYAFDGSIVGYTAAAPSCADCTLRGINKQPDFWTNQ